MCRRAPRVAAINFPAHGGCVGTVSVEVDTNLGSSHMSTRFTVLGFGTHIEAGDVMKKLLV